MATTHFRAQMTSAGPGFMAKDSHAEIGALLAYCFGRSHPALTSALAALRERYRA